MHKAVVHILGLSCQIWRCRVAQLVVSWLAERRRPSSIQFSPRQSAGTPVAGVLDEPYSQLSQFT